MLLKNKSIPKVTTASYKKYSRLHSNLSVSERGWDAACSQSEAGRESNLDGEVVRTACSRMVTRRSTDADSIGPRMGVSRQAIRFSPALV